MQLLHVCKAALVAKVAAACTPCALSVCSVLQGGPSWRPAGAVASSCGWGGHAWPALMQEVDLVEQLRLRGLSHAAACAFLDSCPALLLEVGWGWSRQERRRAMFRCVAYGADDACAMLRSAPATAPLCCHAQVFTAGRFDCPGEFEARLVLDSRSGPVPAAHFECA